MVEGLSTQNQVSLHKQNKKNKQKSNQQYVS